MTKERGGKERVDTSQKGISKPPAGHWQWKPPSAPLVQVPPLRHTPGTQRPERLSTSQFSPGGSETQDMTATQPLLALGVQTSTQGWGRAATRQELLGWLGAGKECDNPSVTQVSPAS